MTTLSRPVKVDFHVGDDLAADGKLTCRCTKREKKKVFEPIQVKDGDPKEDGVEFRLMNKEYEFVGFISPQDRRHECFEVVSIDDNTRGHSIMSVADTYVEGSEWAGDSFDYELVFQQRANQPGNLYHYDPQIKNN